MCVISNDCLMSDDCLVFANNNWVFFALIIVTSSDTYCQNIKTNIITILTVHEALDPVILLRGLKGDEVHAALPAVVPGIEPAPVAPLQLEVSVQPAEVVIMVSKSLNSSFADSCKDEELYFLTRILEWLIQLDNGS